jgi:DNA-binding IclR family transcriptional regulator
MGKPFSKADRARLRSAGKRSQKSVLGVQVIARAVAILRALEGKDDGLSLGQLAAIVGLPRSTVQRIVAALDSENFVIAASPAARVRLGPAFVRIARSVRFEIVELARPYLEQLSRETGETVDLAVLDGAKAVFLHQIQGTQRLRAVSAVGVSFPLHCTANGKALLAALDPQALEQLRRQMRLDGGVTKHGWLQLLEELEEVRRSGIGYDREEHSPGISAMGTAVIGPRGESAAISIPVPSVRFPEIEGKLAEALLRCRDAIQAILTGGPAETRAEIRA